MLYQFTDSVMFREETGNPEKGVRRNEKKQDTFI